MNRLPASPPARAAAFSALHSAGARRLAWAVLLLVSACQAQTAAPITPVAPVAPIAGSAQVVPSDEAKLMDKLRTEIGDARCSSDAQCRSLAIGHKACGGPQQWWAWSTATARAERLQAWADELAALQQQRREASGMASNCLYVDDPGAVCQAQHCVLRGGASTQ
jgi:hypothetical protein